MSEDIAGSGDVRRLHPASLAVRFVGQLPQFVLAIPAAVYFAAGANLWTVLLVAIAGLVLSTLSAWLYWRNFTYETDGEQLVIESGVLSRNRRTIPFDRIQDVSLEQSLLARIFGVSIVRIETGSSGNDEGKLECVTRSEADRLRDLIRAHRYAGTATSQGEVAEPEIEGPPLFAMRLPRLLLFGFFSFSFVFVALLSGIGQYVFTWLPTRYADPDYYIQMADLPGRGGATMVEMWAWTTSITLGIAVVAAGVVSGLAKVITRDYGFRLTRTESGLRRERGLFTRTDVVIPLRRLQAAIVSTGIVRRRFGWHDLALQSLGSDGKAGTHHDAAPFAQPAELVPIFAEMAMPMPPPRESFHPISRRALWAEGVFPVIALSAAAIASAIFEPPLLVAVGLGAVAIAAIVRLRWSAHGHAIEGATCFARKGVVRPRVTVLPLAKVQSVTLSQNLIQRLFGLVSLKIGTAGAPSRSPLEIPDLDPPEARRMREALLAFA